MYDNSKTNLEKKITFLKKSNNCYKFSFLLENKNYILSSIIDIDLINLIYKLNSDIYESFHSNKISDTESNITLIMKKMLFDVITQKYAFLNIKKEVFEKEIIFNSKMITNYRPSCVNDRLELVNVDSIINKFELIDDHKANCVVEFIFNDLSSLNPILERIFVSIINKMFTRFKNFIEELK